MRMKPMYRTLFSLILLGTLLINAGCHKHHGSGPTDEELQLAKLTGKWKTTSATLDNVVQSGYDAFFLTLTGAPGSSTNWYTATGRPMNSPWPSGGTWTFGSAVLTQVIRDKGAPDELAMTYSVTDTELQLNFQ